MTHPSDDAIWASIAETLREVVLPAVDDDWAHQTVVQLAALADYARTRPDAIDTTGTDIRRERLRRALESLGDNPLLPDRDLARDETAAAAVALAAAAGRADADANVVRNALRPLLLADLDADLRLTEGLEDAFRGRLPDA